jgi:hypothetical protein
VRFDAATEAFPLHETFVKFASTRAAMLVEAAMTKTASGSDGWKCRGWAMPSIRISAALLAGALAASQAAAAPAPNTGSQTNAPAPSQPPLPPGPAASNRQAQNIGRPLLYWAAAGAAIITGVILLSQDSDGTSTTATTSTGN